MKKILITLSLISAFAFAPVQAHAQSAGSFSALQGLLETDYSNSKSISITANITFTDSIVLRGNVNTTIDGTAKTFDGNNKFFYNPGFSAFSSMSFVNLTFANFLSGNNGGGLYISERRTISVSNSKFDHNTTSGSGGGFFTESGSTVTITFATSDGISFSNNFAYQHGGAFYGANGVFVDMHAGDLAKGMSFKDNTSIGFGGAIYISRSTAIFNDDVIFQSNIASSTNSVGGAIYANNSHIKFEAAASFEKNLASLGGALYFSNINTDFLNATFTQNVATSAFITGGFGGAVYLTNSNLNITQKSVFTQNIANFGGALYIASNTFVDFLDVATFEKNNASINGGAIYIGSQNTKVSSMVFNNEVVFKNNQSGSFGGAIYIATGTIVLSSANFENNLSTGSGGAVAIAGGTLNISSADFVYNTSLNGEGGALHITGGVVNIATEGFKAMTFLGNQATSGGTLFMSAGMLNMSTTTFMFSSATNNGEGGGGAFYLTGAATKANFLGEVIFHLNSAAAHGGAMFITGAADIDFEKAVSFSTNTSLNRGGAIYVNNGSITFNGATIFDHNYSGGVGGALFIDGGASRVTFNKPVEFSSNTAEGFSGGAIHIESGFLIFNNTVFFTSNSVSFDGAAIYIGNSGDVRISSNAFFIDNIAGENGGAIHVRGGKLDLDLRNANVIFSGNKAGGVANDIVVEGGSSQTVLTIRGNSPAKILNITGGINMYGKGGIISRPILNINGITLNLKTDSLNDFDFVAFNINNAVLNIDTAKSFSWNTSSIKGSVGTINKNTSWNLDIGQVFQNSLNLNVNKGTVTMTGTQANMKSLFIAAGAVYDLSKNSNGSNKDQVFGSLGSITTVSDDVIINGNVEIFLDIATGELTVINGDKVVLGVTSSMTAHIVGIGIPASPFRVITAGEAGLEGSFLTTNLGGANAKVIYLQGENGVVLLDVSEFASRLAGYSQLTPFERNIAKELDRIYSDNYSVGAMSGDMFDMLYRLNYLGQTGDIEELKKALDNLSGISLINSLRLGAMESEGKINNLYNNIDVSRDKSVWANVFNQSLELLDKNNSSQEKFTSQGSGVMAGGDLFKSVSMIAGVYGGYGNLGAVQGDDDIAITEMELGLYGGLNKGKFRVKSNLAFVVDNFNSRRFIPVSGYTYMPRANYNTLGARFGLETEYVFVLGLQTDLKPFVGVHGGFVSNEQIAEFGGKAANLIIDQATFAKLDSVAGVSIADDIGVFRWFSKLYAGYTFLGGEPKYQIKFTENGNWIDISGVKENLKAGIGAGLSYHLSGKSDGISLFLNGDINIGTNTLGYFVSGGIGYRY